MMESTVNSCSDSGTSGCLVHWKMETCASLQPIQICSQIFSDREHLCVLHKGKNENPHWHFQGMCDDVKALDKQLKEWANGHTKKIASEKSRPVKRAKKEITAEGYQYMMKENPPVVVSTTFTEEELAELHERSEGHNDQLKNQLLFCLMEKLNFDMDPKYAEKAKDPVWAAKYPTLCEVPEPKAIHKQARALAMDHYLELNKLPPPNLQKLILWHILRIAIEKVPSTLVGVYKDYVGARI